MLVKIVYIPKKLKTFSIANTYSPGSGEVEESTNKIIKQCIKGKVTSMSLKPIF